MEERLKLAKEQADDATKKMQELKVEIAELKAKVERRESAENVAAAIAHADIKASNVLAANNIVSTTLEPFIFSKHTRFVLTDPDRLRRDE